MALPTNRLLMVRGPITQKDERLRRKEILSRQELGKMYGLLSFCGLDAIIRALESA